MIERVVAAAGGVVWRPSEKKLQVAVIHRPRYDDWTLPKGKLNTGESEITAAVREVREEIGAEVSVSRRLHKIRYHSGVGHKSVAYWAMRYVDGTFRPNAEVDAVEWLPLGKAAKALSYDIDRSVLADFAATPTADSVIVLVRHAKAGRRSRWTGPDEERPLEDSGRLQAKNLVQLLGYFGPTRVYSASPVRCVQTVEPLAEALGKRVHLEPAFDDENYLHDPAASTTALLALAKPGKVSVVCSQGITIPSLIERLAPGVASSDTRKGAVWVISLVDGDVVAADHYEASN